MSEDIKNYKRQLTVGKLRKILGTYPNDCLVWSEGCDCNGEVGGVTYLTKKKSVILMRTTED